MKHAVRLEFILLARRFQSVGLEHKVVEGVGVNYTSIALHRAVVSAMICPERQVADVIDWQPNNLRISPLLVRLEVSLAVAMAWRHVGDSQF